jgi:hypothetical protein
LTSLDTRFSQAQAVFEDRMTEALAALSSEGVDA